MELIDVLILFGWIALFSIPIACLIHLDRKQERQKKLKEEEERQHDLEVL